MMCRSLYRLSHELPPLPYSRNALEPFISKETIDYHYGKHHLAYVNKLNEIIAGNPSFEDKTLEAIIRSEDGPVFNQAAQIWNHTFYWNSMKPGVASSPPSLISKKLEDDFGSLEAFRKEFSTCAAGHFGSGWAWLVLNKEGKLKVTQGHDAMNPLKDGNAIPILTCDVWEHAYYIDYRNGRPAYVDAWWNVVNWDFANKNLSEAMNGTTG